MWETVPLTGGAVIRVIPECCAAAGTVELVLSVGDNISLWKGMSVGSQARGVTGRGESFPFTPPLRTEPLSLNASELTAEWLYLEKADCGICLHGRAYQVALSELLPFVGQRIVFFWESDWGGPLPRRDPYITLPNGSPANDTLLEEANGTRWMVFGETGFTGGTRAALDRMYGTYRVNYVPDGSPARFLKRVPPDGTVLKEEDRTTWVMVAGTRFPVPNDETLQRVAGGATTYKLWEGGLSRIPTAPGDGTLLGQDDGRIWVIFGGARFHVPDPARLERLYGGREVIPLWDGGLDAIPFVPIDGTLLREENGAIWIIFAGARFPVPDPGTLSRLYSGRPIGQVWDGAVDAIPKVPVDGTLLREENGSIWVVLGGAKFHVPDPPTLDRLFRGRPIHQLWDGALRDIPDAPVDGTLLRESTGFIWVIFGEAKFLVPGRPTLDRLYSGRTIHDLWPGALGGLPTIPVNGRTLHDESGLVWVMAGGARFHVPDPPTLERLYGGRSVGQLWSGSLNGIPTTPSDGAILREESGAFWVIYGGARFHVPDPTTYARLYADSPVGQLWDGALSAIPVAPVDGTLLREENGSIWVIFGAAKFHVPDPATLQRLFSGTPIGQVWDGAINDLGGIPRDGTRLREESSDTIYEMRDGHKVPLLIPGRVARVRVLWDGALAQIP